MVKREMLKAGRMPKRPDPPECVLISGRWMFFSDRPVFRIKFLRRGKYGTADAMNSSSEEITRAVSRWSASRTEGAL